LIEARPLTHAGLQNQKNANPIAPVSAKGLSFDPHCEPFDGCAKVSSDCVVAPRKFRKLAKVSKHFWRRRETSKIQKPGFPTRRLPTGLAHVIPESG
jgi:hypothetical protein